MVNSSLTLFWRTRTDIHYFDLSQRSWWLFRICLHVEPISISTVTCVAVKDNDKEALKVVFTAASVPLLNKGSNEVANYQLSAASWGWCNLLGCCNWFGTTLSLGAETGWGAASKQTYSINYETMKLKNEMIRNKGETWLQI